MQSLVLLTRTMVPGGKASETASLVYSPYSSTARGQALLMSSLDGHVSLFKLADAAVSASSHHTVAVLMQFQCC